MDENAMLGHIHELVDEEKRLRAAHSGLSDEDRTRLQSVEQQLDQCWDLLRRRRAADEFGQPTDNVAERSVGEVEGYLQ